MKKLSLLLLLMVLGAFFWWRIKGSAQESSRKLTLYIYANYLDPTVLVDFKKEYGIDVIEENCSSNEEVEGKLKAGATGYDIIVPSDYMVQRFAQQGLIQALDLSKVPNRKHLSPRFQRPLYDPEGRFVVPYMWGTTGIGYNSKLVGQAPHSWKQLFDPEWLVPLKKRISLLDDPREVVGAAIKANGGSYNSADPKDLDKAKELLTRSLPHVSRIDSNSFKDLLASGDIWVAQGYSGDILRLRKELPEIAYVIPDEGGAIWADNLAIPSSSKNVDIAHLFINFLMRPEINARIARTIHYASTNEAAKAFIPKEQLEDTSIYPTQEMQDKLEWFVDLGEQADAIDTLWNEVRALGPLEETASP